MGVYKNTEIRKNVLETCRYAEHVAVHTTASDCLLSQSLAKLVAT